MNFSWEKMNPQQTRRLSFERQQRETGLRGSNKAHAHAGNWFLKPGGEEDRNRIEWRLRGFSLLWRRQCC